MGQRAKRRRARDQQTIAHILGRVIRLEREADVRARDNQQLCEEINRVHASLESARRTAENFQQKLEHPRPIPVDLMDFSTALHSLPATGPNVLAQKMAMPPVFELAVRSPTRAADFRPTGDETIMEPIKIPAVRALVAAPGVPPMLGWRLPAGIVLLDLTTPNRRPNT